MSELDRWQNNYATNDYIFGTGPNAFLKAETHRLKTDWKALSLADGEGRNGVWLAERGLEVHTLDFSSNAVAKAKKLAADRGVTLKAEQADLTQWRWPTSAYDVIVGIFFQFANPQERARIFAGIKQALKPGGLLLLQGYRAEQLQFGTGGPKQLDHLYTRTLFEEAFKDFASIDIRTHDSVLAEGSRHVGLSALIDLVGVK